MPDESPEARDALPEASSESLPQSSISGEQQGTPAAQAVVQLPVELETLLSELDDPGMGALRSLINMC